MDASQDMRIPYKPKAWLMLAGVVFFGACLAVFVAQLLGGRLGTLDLIVFGLLAVASVVFVVIGLVAFFSALTSKIEIVVTKDSISAPKSGIARKSVTVQFRDQIGLDVTAVGRQKFLDLSHPGGTLNIAAQSLPKGVSPEDLFHAVHERRERLMGQG